MAYPTSPTDGQKVGANLCPRPQFSDALNAGNWVGQNAVAANNAVNCLKIGPQPTNVATITLPGVPVTPATFKITVQANSSSSTMAIGVRPVGSTRVVTAQVAKTTTSGPVWKATFTDSIVAGDTGTAVELYIKPVTAAGAYVYLANIRIDYSDSTAGDVNWYMDGATPDTANYDYSWDGTALYSQSSANYINVDATPPSVPTGLTVTGTTASSISLSWNAATDNVAVTGYNVYDGTTKVTTTPITATTYTHSGLAESSSHTYKVTALDAKGNESAKSTQVAATVGYVPHKPLYPVQVDATSHSITLSWTPPSKPGGGSGPEDYDPTVTGYNVFEGATKLTATPVPAATLPAHTTYLHDGLAAESSHTYTVTALSAYGESFASAPGTATTKPAPPPAHTGYPQPPFAAPADVGVVIGRNYGPGLYFPALNPETIVTLGELVCRPATFKIWLQYSAASNNGSVGLRPAGSTEVNPPNIPATPGGWLVITDTIDITDVDREVELYVNVHNAAAVVVNYYRVDYDDSPALDYFPSVSGDIEGEHYEWDGDEGRSTSTAYFTDIEPDLKLPMPSVEPPTALDIPYFGRTSNSLRIEWEENWSPAPYGLDGYYPTPSGRTYYSAPDGYNVYGIGADTGYFDTNGNPVLAEILLTSTPITDLFYVATTGVKDTDPNSVNKNKVGLLESETTYGFSVRSVRLASSNEGPKIGSSYSDVTGQYSMIFGDTLAGAPPPPDTTPPSTPAGLAVTGATTTTITLVWTASTDNVAVTGYDIYEGATKRGSTTQTTYTATGLTQETAHTYTVMARDAAGNVSPASSPVTGTTLAPPPPDTTPPTAPTNLTASGVTQTTITLTWTAATDNVGVTGYKVYEGATVRATIGPQTAYTAAGLQPQTQHSYSVTALDAAGNESLSSGVASATTTAGVPDPDPDPDPGGPDPTPPPAVVDESDPWANHAALAAQLGPRIAAFVGRAGDPDVITAAIGYVAPVAEYVRGYTRGRGFNVYSPAGPLRMVIVAAAARLVANPDQVEVYTTGDYTEKPATLTGWTLPELAVLRRYRKLAQ